jgi:hypothetical protein
MTQRFSSADRALARRLEAGHAHSAAASMTGLTVEPIGDAWAIFHQVDSPISQAIGLGMSGAGAPDDLERLEAFYHSRCSAAVIDLCTLADPGLLAMIFERGYTVREVSNVLVRRLDRAERFEKPIAVEPVAEHEFASWMRMTVQGFASTEDVPEDSPMLGEANPWPEAFFGLSEGVRAATAAMDIHDGLATLFGDATLIQARGRGLQLALIHHRLERAAQLGCDLATASVQPGGISHRNYERAGFELVYARVMVGRPKP